jgi:hypothetical protein
MSVQSSERTEPDWDPREQIEYSVLLPNGRLAPRRFGSREEAQAWADLDAGEEVVSFNQVCDCEM